MKKSNGFADLGELFIQGLEKNVRRIEPEDGDAADEQIGFIDCASFMEREFVLEWVVKHMLVRHQPCMIGGPKKALKTSLIVDLAAAMSSGGKFLGQFSVTQPVRVGVISGESGGATLKETFKRVCQAKGITQPELLPVCWGFRLPRLSETAEVDELVRAVGENNLEVLILDPLYLCLLAGNPNLQASNLFQMGPLLSRVSEACLKAGATPIFVHHSRMEKAADYQPLELESLAYAGVQEFARQWILVGRREKYEPGSGKHRMWLNVGGSAGFSGCWAVDVDEGVVRDDFGGRRWVVAVRSATNERQAVARQREHDKEVKTQEQKGKDRHAIVEVLQQHPGGETLSMLASLAGISKDRARAALATLTTQGRGEECCVHKGGGKGGNRGYQGYRLVAGFQPEGESLSENDEDDDE